MEFSRQEYCSGLPFPSPEDLPDLGIEPGSLTLQVASLLSEPPEKPPIEVDSNTIRLFSGLFLGYYRFTFLLRAIAAQDIVLSSFCFSAPLCSMWDLSSLTRDASCVTCIGSSES